MIARIRSFAVTPGRSVPLTLMRKRAGLTLQQALRRENVSHLGRTDTECKRAYRAMRARVAVAADDRLTGLRDSQLRYR